MTARPDGRAVSEALFDAVKHTGFRDGLSRPRDRLASMFEAEGFEYRIMGRVKEDSPYTELMAWNENLEITERARKALMVHGFAVFACVEKRPYGPTEMMSVGQPNVATGVVQESWPRSISPPEKPGE